MNIPPKVSELRHLKNTARGLVERSDMSLEEAGQLAEQASKLHASLTPEELAILALLDPPPASAAAPAVSAPVAAPAANG